MAEWRPANVSPIKVTVGTPIHHAANTTQHRHHGGTGGYGSAIRSIDINGQHFDLQKPANP